MPLQHRRRFSSCGIHSRLSSYTFDAGCQQKDSRKLELFNMHINLVDLYVACNCIISPSRCHSSVAKMSISSGLGINDQPAITPYPVSPPSRGPELAPSPPALSIQPASLMVRFGDSRKSCRDAGRAFARPSLSTVYCLLSTSTPTSYLVTTAFFTDRKPGVSRR